MTELRSPPQATQTILVIEDDADLLTIVTQSLEHLGYQVLQARNGREGLDVLAARCPDLILLDMKMPVMNGWDFAAALPPPPGRPPLVIMTAADSAQRRALEVGADGWIGKPFGMTELHAAVTRHLRGSAP